MTVDVEHIDSAVAGEFRILVGEDILRVGPGGGLAVDDMHISPRPAYWAGPGGFWRDVLTLARIHLRLGAFNGLLLSAAGGTRAYFYCCRLPASLHVLRDYL